MATKRSSNQQASSEDLKLFTMIYGEPKKLDCDFRNRGPPPLFWAKSKEDVVKQLISTKSKLLEAIPLNKDSGYSHTPSDFHHVYCVDQSCPCSKYTMCWNCERTKVSVPKGGVEILCCGEKERLEDAGEGNCVCDEPNFRGQDKVKLCLEALDDCNDSDYCCLLLDLNIASATKCTRGSEVAAGAPPKPKAAKHE